MLSDNHVPHNTQDCLHCSFQFLSLYLKVRYLNGTHVELDIIITFGNIILILAHILLKKTDFI